MATKKTTPSWSDVKTKFGLIAAGLAAIDGRIWRRIKAR